MTEIGLCTHPKNTLCGRKYRVQRRLHVVPFVTQRQLRYNLCVLADHADKIPYLTGLGLAQ